MDKTSLIHSFRYIHIDRDLPRSFQMPHSIDNIMHTPILQPIPRYIHTSNDCNSIQNEAGFKCIVLLEAELSPGTLPLTTVCCLVRVGVRVGLGLV